jgi:site-specific DNA-methyltransferase (adenine-specific)
MMVSSVLFSSNREDWETPFYLYDKWNKEFHFDLDPAASENNSKCKNFFTATENGLLQDWYNPNKGYKNVFVNPPYSRMGTSLWVRKMTIEAEKGALVVALLPARTDTKWFHQSIYPYYNNKLTKITTEIHFLKGRIQFEINNKPVLDTKGRAMRAPFPSMLVTFKAVFSF